MDKLELTQEELEQKIADALSEKEDALAKELKDKNDELLGKLNKAKEKAKEIERAKELEVERAKQSKLESEGKHEELVVLLRSQIEGLEKDLAKSKEANETNELNLKKILIDKGLSEAFLDAGVTNSSLLEAAVAIHGPLAEIVTNEESGMPEVLIAGKSVDSFIGEWSEGKGKAFIDFGNTGGDATGLRGSDASEYEQYFRPETKNLTKQKELESKDPEQYGILRNKYKQKESLPLQSTGR